VFLSYYGVKIKGIYYGVKIKGILYIYEESKEKNISPLQNISIKITSFFFFLDNFIIEGTFL